MLCSGHHFAGSVPPFISVIVPLRNEEAAIARLARSLLDQDYPRDRYEILMADGGSTDRTLDILREVDADRRIRVIDNPSRTAPAGLNVLVAASRGEIIARVDGHSFVASDYLQRIVAVMQETGEAVVGGPVLMQADTPFRRALAEALYSPVGVGRVPYRTLRRRGYVASLQTGAFRREVHARVGPFDERLPVVEDLDFNTRVGQAGFRLLLDPSIRFWYVPRANLRLLWRQIHGVGRIKVFVLRKHPEIVKLKYLVPGLVVVVLALSLAGLLVAAWGGPRWPAAIGAIAIAGYATLVGGFALSRAWQLGAAALWLLAILPVLHVGYGTGFLRGLLASLVS
jgi:glycosyltransferase involved in cell wall biosynthesis